jgi:ABC-2 type transport system ATP-binding protein
VGLTEILPRQVRAYSDGMRQRLALARALGTDARLWLLDEPTRSLDPEAQRTFRALIRQLVRERDATVLVATHDLAEAAELCDRVAVLRRGRVAACDRPADLVARYGSLAAAYRSAAEGRD